MPRLAPSSLTARLVATVVMLVALVSILISALTTVAMNGHLTARLDDQVEESWARARGAFEHGASNRPPAEPDEERHEEGPDVELAIGQAAGTLTAYVDEYGERGDVITASSDRHPLSPAALQTLAGVPADGTVHHVDLPALGGYRVVADQTEGATIVAGLPTDDITQTLGSLVGWEALLTLAGVAATAGVGLLLIRRQLRPLREVATAAHEVTELPLSTGEVGVTVRVPDPLTDPRTEVGQVGLALNKLLGHMEQALDARHRSEQQVRQFVADASHELRTPLSTIHGYAELSRRTAPSDPARLSQAMAKVESEATRMSSLVDDLLLLARLDAGRPLERNEVDLTKLVLEAVSDARVVGPGHRWALELPGEPVVVTGDEQRLHQVLTNLLGNARRHTPPGTTVTVGVHPEGAAQGQPTKAVLTVRDDGPGIPEDMLSTVFERFSRGDSSRTRASGGAGLGLSLVRAITAAHGGTVDVSSRPGSTVFTVRLPAKPGNGRRTTHRHPTAHARRAGPVSPPHA